MGKDLKDQTLEELEQIVVGLGQKKYLAGYLFKFIHVQNGGDLGAVSTLSKAFRTELVEQGCFISRLRTVDCRTDRGFPNAMECVGGPRDGSAKYLFELGDGERIEAVLLGDPGPGSPTRDSALGSPPHRRRIACGSPTKRDASRLGRAPKCDALHLGTRTLPDEQRRTLCVSTQVGCAMGCAFCATGRIAFRRNLTAGEIVAQVNAVCSVPVRAYPEADENRITPDGVTTNRVTNIVYMGMGEPLQNYDAVLKSVRILNHPAGKNIGLRHITISTCGIAPAIRQLADEDVQPRLAISLNAPADALRSRLMPINRKYPLGELLNAVRAYQARTHQRVTFEYVLIEKVNDSVNHARMLVKLLRGLVYNVNVIEHNPFSGCEFTGSSRERVGRFVSVLKDAGVETTTRFRMGRRIQAACGQLQAGLGVKREV